ncbi:MAG: GNAT family N-acetyltransferase, partial [Clostridia bacterium]|nr:GNAT family N-acetyltransferase [Clostridia bacterium]
MKIETKRLIITDMTMDMAMDVHQNSLDEDMKRFVPDEVFETLEEAQETIAFIQSQYGSANGPLVYAVLTKDEGKNIGYVQLVPIGEGQWEIGYHIAKAYTGMGYATEAVRAFLPVISADVGVREVHGIRLLENSASGRVLQKCGFQAYFTGEGAYHDGIHTIRKSVWKKENCTIRLETESDHRAVENLVRESFWNVYRPGCSEHLVIHVLRNDPAFVKELDFVMEQDGRLIGQNMFMKTVIEADDGRVIPVLTMGPIGITPELKRQGYGKRLLDFCLEKAAAMGFGAVLFEGNILFYSHCGFDYARKFGIRYHDLPEGADDSFFLCKELIPGYLDGITGVYQTPKGY